MTLDAFRPFVGYTLFAAAAHVLYGLACASDAILLARAGPCAAIVVAFAFSWPAADEVDGDGRVRITVLPWVAAGAAITWLLSGIELAGTTPALGITALYLAIVIRAVTAAAASIVSDAAVVHLVLLAALGIALCAIGRVMGESDATAWIANLGRLGLAVCGGVVLARMTDRLWWSAALCCVISIVDVWSVFAASGPSRQILAADGSIADALFVVSPMFNGAPAAEIGLVDFLFVAMFGAVCGRWSLDRHRVELALVCATVLGLLLASATEVAIPLLPLLGPAFVGIYAREIVADARGGQPPIT